jgi:23S rRNA (cytidine2498-2'-O)-methyltransferase
MDLLLTDAASEPFLREELARAHLDAKPCVLAPGLVGAEFNYAQALPPIVFARQLLPDAEEKQAVSINAWSQQLLESVTNRLPEGQPWLLHVAPRYGEGGAGENRCRFIREAFRELLQRRRRQLLKHMQPAPQPFTPAASLVQLLLTSPEQGFLSIAVAPRPHELRRVMSPFPKGELAVAGDKAAPSRAFAKLVEAEQRLGLRIGAGETVVDLGASPGSWSYVALRRGAQVIAVDRSPLREDLMRNPRLTFQKGDAFAFQPPAPADWLVCDVIAAPQRSIDLVLDWVRARRCRRFVVTIKFKGHAEYAALDQLKTALPPLCDDFFLTRLCANKNEACAFGTVARTT